MTRPLTHIMQAASVVLVLVMSPLFVAADMITYSVPTDYATIQSAIDAADNLLSQPTNTHSFEVLVEPGTYVGPITLKRNIPLRGRQTAQTILSGGGAGTALTANGISGVSVRNFTFRNAQIGILVSGNAVVSIENNVFSVGNAGTAVQVSGAPFSKVVNNSFVLNGNAVARDADSILVDNNIFSDNTTNIFQNSNLETNITFNDFDPIRQSVEYRGTNFIPNATYPDPDPLFVNGPSLDLHLRSGSPCISTGNPSNSGIQDRGAYGGSATDNIPATVTDVASTATSTTSVTVSWSANLDYRVTGYKVYYGIASGIYTGIGMVTGATSTLISGLTTTVGEPAQPVLNQPPEPRSGSLVLSWAVVSGATSYDLHYSLDSAPTVTTTLTNVGIVAGNTVSYTLSGLTNNARYWIAVTAVAQPALYSAVTATYEVTGVSAIGPGIGYESAYSVESKTFFGDLVSGPTSTPVLGMPETLQAYPSLPNTGCFIATAAYGSENVTAVLALREFRDRFLRNHAPGRAFIRWYYSFSPAAARLLNEHPALRPFVRAALAPAVAVAVVFNQAPPLAPAVAAVLLIALTVLLAYRKRALCTRHHTGNKS